ncbi:MAG TPA: hypothetical protein VGL86_33920 [Polyangia bacterium]
MRTLELAHRLWFHEASRMLGYESFALIARGERARRIRSYVAMREWASSRGRKWRDLLVVFRVGRKFHSLYAKGKRRCKAIGAAHPDGETVVVTFYSGRAV